MATDGGEPFFRNVNAIIAVNVSRVQKDLDRFLNLPCIPVFVLRYAMELRSAPANSSAASASGAKQ